MAHIVNIGSETVDLHTKEGSYKYVAAFLRDQGAASQVFSCLESLKPAHSHTVTCVYCGYAYPEDTPTHGAPVLTAHIKNCPEHPLRQVEEENKKLYNAHLCKLCDGVLPVSDKTIILASGTPAEIGPICLPCANTIIDSLNVATELGFQCSYCGEAIKIGEAESIKEAARAHDEACEAGPLKQVRKDLEAARARNMRLQSQLHQVEGANDHLKQRLQNAITYFEQSGSNGGSHPREIDKMIAVVGHFINSAPLGSENATLKEAHETMRTFLKAARERLLDKPSTKD